MATQAKTAELDAKLALIASFEAHLASAKYQGIDSDATSTSACVRYLQ